MYLGLQVGRGIAALLVVLSHATIGAEVFYGRPFDDFWYFGYIGVDFFFVLSGFIIYHAHRHDPRGRAAWWLYAKKRIIRIYPPFIVVSIVLLAVHQLAPGLSRVDRDIGLVTSLFLVPTGKSPALAPSWTLMHEMLFYGAFSLWFLSRRAFALLFGLWGAAILAYRPAADGHLWPSFLLDPHNLEFLIGVAISWLVARGHRGHQALLAAGILLVAAFAVGSYLFDIDRLFGSLMGRVLYLGTAFGLLVWGLCFAEERQSPRFPSALVFLGAASYSVYLVHEPAIAVLNRVASALSPSATVPAEAWFLAVVALATLAGILYHLWWERPVLRLLQRRWLPRRGSPVPGPAAGGRPG
jgi:hypothetical protein